MDDMSPKTVITFCINPPTVNGFSSLQPHSKLYKLFGKVAPERTRCAIIDGILSWDLLIFGIRIIRPDIYESEFGKTALILLRHQTLCWRCLSTFFLNISATAAGSMGHA
jgi:hypothetical protein